MKKIKFFATVLACLCWSNVSSQIKPDMPVYKELYDVILKKDSMLFSAANKGDIDRLKISFTKDLEFSHDLGGLAGYDGTRENFSRVAKNYAYTGSTLNQPNFKEKLGNYVYAK